MRTERGQAMIEVAIGLFALAFVVSALWAYTHYVARSLEIENHLRGNQKGVADKIELDDFAAEKVFGTHNLHIKEPFSTMDRVILK